MGKTLTEIAQTLREAKQKVQLIYAFNGVGKTRLSREFKELIAPKNSDTEEQGESGIKIIYYNAFTEDLFYWDNDLNEDEDRKLIIRPNGFTDLTLNFLKDEGQDMNITTHFQRYTNKRITPIISTDFSEVVFSVQGDNETTLNNIKISRGEESNFIWCIFYSLLEQIISVLNTVELDDRSTDKFNQLEYVFIDDPVSSLDDTHLIELAVNIAELIKLDKSDLKYIITTHNPLFYNILFNEFKNDNSSSGYKKEHCVKRRLEKREDGTFSLIRQPSDSPFSYHLFLLSELEKAIDSNNIQKYHFNFLRNILEKTSTFLGYTKWGNLLPNETEGSQKAYYNRIINLLSHGKHSGEEISVIEDNDKRVLSYLVEKIREIYHFREKNVNNPN